jgi:arylsulfatase A-like enzyme
LSEFDALDEMGATKDTLILWEIGDNGSSMEGTLNGAYNEFASMEELQKILPTSSKTSTKSADPTPTITSR